MSNSEKAPADDGANLTDLVPLLGDFSMQCVDLVAIVLTCSDQCHGQVAAEPLHNFSFPMQPISRSISIRNQIYLEINLESFPSLACGCPDWSGLSFILYHFRLTLLISCPATLDLQPRPSKLYQNCTIHPTPDSINRR